jgi:hypothetical protein
MAEDARNKFNGKKPFDIIRAEDFGGELYEFYEPLEKLIREVSGVDITGSRPVMLIGGRGTGKTMVLKFLSVEMQLKDYIKNDLNKLTGVDNLKLKDMKKFLKNKTFIGIYLRFKTTEYGAVRGNLAPLFMPFLSIKLAEQIFNTLLIFKRSELISSRQETRIVEYFIDQIEYPKVDNINNFEDVLRTIRKKIIRQFELIFDGSSHYSKDEMNSEIRAPILISKNLIFGLADFIFSNIKYLEGKYLFILLDEFEFLDETQIRTVSKLIKDSTETVSFKIGSRHMPPILPVGDTEEVLQEIHDFRKINIMDVMNAAQGRKKNNYHKLITTILNKRLEKSDYFRENGITDITQLFPSLTFREEALYLISQRDDKEAHWKKFKTALIKASFSIQEIDKIVSDLKYPNDPIIEKLNMLLSIRGSSSPEIKNMYQDYLDKRNKKYADLYQKNALNLLIQLYSDYKIDKRYMGIDVFVSLSSGIIRYAIELCNQGFQIASNYGYIPSQGKPIPYICQDMGAKKFADLCYYDIARISGKDYLGLRVQKFINEIGTIFRALHRDPYLAEPEPTHFETSYLDITVKAREIFDAALDHSYLQEKPPMDPKLPIEAKKSDFVLNRIFSPKFGISYRVRGRTFFSPTQIEDLLVGDDKKRMGVRSEIIKPKLKRLSANNVKHAGRGVQKSLFELPEEE